MEDDPAKKAAEWRTAHGDLSDEEWALIGDLFAPYWSPGKMGRPIKHNRRDIVDAIFFVLSTGCQWRALPENYPHWNTVHRYHLKWSCNGTWKGASYRLREQFRVLEQRDGSPSAGVIDARSVRGTSMVSAVTRGYDAGKKISGRKTFGVVDTLGLLIAVVVVTANTSDNVGGMKVVDIAKTTCPTLRKLLVRWRIQENVHHALQRQESVSRSRKPNRFRKVRSASSPLGSGTVLVVANEQSQITGRL